MDLPFDGEALWMASGLQASLRVYSALGHLTNTYILWAVCLQVPKLQGRHDLRQDVPADLQHDGKGAVGKRRS